MAVKKRCCAEIYPRQIIAGAPCTLRIEYIVAKGGIAKGGGLELTVSPRCSWWAIPQVVHPSLAGYVGVSVDSKKAELTTEVVSGCFPVIIRVTIGKATLKAGEKVTVIFGDPCEGGPGLVTPPYTHKFKFIISIDKKGTGNFQETGQTPKVDIVGGKIERLSFVAPSIVTVGEKFNVNLCAQTNWLNPVDGKPPLDYRAMIKFNTTDKCKLSKGYTFTGKERGRRNFPGSILAAGTHTLRAEDVTHSIKAKSNPVQCYKSAPQFKLYWGDLHVHSTAWDAQLSPADVYKYANEVAGLDWAVVSEHVQGLTDADWNEIKRAAKKYNVPGTFVTLLGFEWSNKFGHRNVYYRKGNQPRFAGDNIADLWKFLEDRGQQEAILIPHQVANPQPAKRFDWDQHNPKFERLVEICSCVGQSERYTDPTCPGQKSNLPATGRYVQDALARGYRLGMTASTDSHSSHAGQILGYGWEGMITGIYAEELTRESLWQALWNRRCYGTTGARIILDFKLNGHHMGHEIKLNHSKKLHRKIKVNVAGTSKIKTIDIVRNNKDIYTYNGRSHKAGFEYEDKDALGKILISTPTDRFAYYYIRVKQIDGNMAWSSPIWISSQSI